MNVTMKENVYTVIAESSRGPQIILYRNSVGVQFSIDPKYPRTIAVLNNFVGYMMQRFQLERERFDVPIAFALKDSIYGAGPRTSSLLEEKNKMKANKAAHSGFAFSMRKGEPLTVQVNAIRGEVMRFSNKLKSPDRHDDSVSGNSNSTEEKRESPAKRTGFLKKATTMAHINEGVIQPVQSEYLSLLGKDFIDSLPLAWKSKKEIRELLHPGYPTHLMPKRGNLLNGKNLILTKSDFEFYEKPLIRQVMSPRPYCRYREFNYLRESLPALNHNQHATMSNWETIRSSMGNTYRSTFSHRFREETRHSWVGGHFRA